MDRQLTRQFRRKKDATKAASPTGAETSKLKRKAYDKALRKLHVELCHLQEWVKSTGARVIVVFEGRDAAGKGGTIKALTERVSPRVFRVVALPAPSDREKSQMFLQRYIQQFPAAGEIIVFDRSWYNRAGVERVMGFVSEEQYDRFLRSVPADRAIRRRRGDSADQGLAGGREGRAGKAVPGAGGGSAAPVEAQPHGSGSYGRWYEYSKARDRMLKATDTKHAPWYIVRSDDKRRARLNCISHILHSIPYKKVKQAKVKLPKRSDKGKYDDQATLKGRHFVAERY